MQSFLWLNLLCETWKKKQLIGHCHDGAVIQQNEADCLDPTSSDYEGVATLSLPGWCSHCSQQLTMHLAQEFWHPLKRRQFIFLLQFVICNSCLLICCWFWWISSGMFLSFFKKNNFSFILNMFGFSGSLPLNACWPLPDTNELVIVSSLSAPLTTVTVHSIKIDSGWKSRVLVPVP